MKRFKKKIRKSYLKALSSFTLIELIIFIVLFSLLIFMVLRGIKVQLQRARDTRRKADVGAMRKVLDEYFDDAGCYPSCPVACDVDLSFGSVTYLSSIPCDPTSGSSYRYVTDDSSCPSQFQLYAKLENAGDSLIDSVGCRGGCGPDCEYNYGVSSPNIGLNSCDVVYVCAPGGGSSGSCQVYQSPQMSECPKVYPNDPTCNNECSDPQNRCKNASGKSVPIWKMETSC